jgi:hypothetical protein
MALARMTDRKCQFTSWDSLRYRGKIMTIAAYRRLRRTEASNYLREKYGISRKPTTLAKLATMGGGPRFQRANRVPLYPEPELDRWAEGLMSPLMSSTSDGLPATPSQPAGSAEP